MWVHISNKRINPDGNSPAHQKSSSSPPPSLGAYTSMLRAKTKVIIAANVWGIKKNTQENVMSTE